ncbi:GNAT family N-acetyltransferase [Longirhabdus pacifica]|uniref:GNAT family N-acetyltransferase n=1 Tax=Longirhabdus pacifica TaxID=2305227 RepID=UPI00100889F6|nr:GNAT family N-acetyltransferase [Longirhabdus pacifica]
MIIRKAHTNDCNTLSNIAYKSKGYWGYSEEFLQSCKNELTITKSYMDRNHVWVIEENNEMIGFYSFSLETEKLDALFIDPEYIGNGIGKFVWKHLLHHAKQLQMEKFTIDSDPNAEGFYLKMGAKRIGDIASTVFPKRKLPLLIVNVK